MNGNDLALLRAYEPIVAFTEGELFFPTDVEGYVRRCSLRRRRSDGKSEQIVVGGELTLDSLVDQAGANAGAGLYLVFVHRPFGRREVRRWYRAARPVIARTGRLAAVGLVARIVDLLMRVSLLVRARGDGITVGPGGDRTWNPVPIDDTTRFAVAKAGIHHEYTRTLGGFGRFQTVGAYARRYARGEWSCALGKARSRVYLIRSR